MYQNSNPIKTVMNETNLHVVGLLTTETNGFYRYNLFDNLEKGIESITHKESIFANRNKYYKSVIAITMYNEDLVSLTDTLSGVFENRISNWKNTKLLAKTLVIIISDGCEVLNKNEDVKKKLEEWKLYSEEEIKPYLNKEVNKDLGFIFEGKLRYSTEVNIYKQDVFNTLALENDEIIDIIFMTKEKNKKKLNSHLWLYKYFCKKWPADYIVVRFT